MTEADNLQLLQLTNWSRNFCSSNTALTVRIFSGIFNKNAQLKVSVLPLYLTLKTMDKLWGVPKCRLMMKDVEGFCTVLMETYHTELYDLSAIKTTRIQLRPKRNLIQ